MRKLKSAAPNELLGSLIASREEILQNTRKKDTEAKRIGRYIGYVVELEQSVRTYIESVSTQGPQKVGFRSSADLHWVLQSPRIPLEEKTAKDSGLELTVQLEHISRYSLLQKKTPQPQKLGITYRAGEHVMQKVFGNIGKVFGYARTDSTGLYSLIKEDVRFQEGRPDERCNLNSVGFYAANLRQLNDLGAVAIELPKDWRVHE